MTAEPKMSGITKDLDLAARCDEEALMVELAGQRRFRLSTWALMVAGVPGRSACIPSP
jgi:hypothetical protein